MTKLDSAIKKFSSALERLENAAQETSPSGTGLTPGFEKEIAVELSVLKQDRARLAEELTRLNVEKIALEGFTDEVAGKLEGAIREIRAVLSH